MKYPEEDVREEEARIRARRTLTSFMLFAIVMFFAALLSAYVVSKGSTDYWVRFSLPKVFWVSTAIILVSSVTAQLALRSARVGQGRASALLLGLTLVLGLAFTWTQFKGWGQLFERGYALMSRVKSIQGTYGTDYSITRRDALTGNDIPLELVSGEYFRVDDPQHTRPLNAEMDEFKNTAGSYFYVLTYAHWAHLVGGLIALLVMGVKAFLGRYSPQRHVGLWAGVLYWHFLTGLWVAILSFLAFVH
jgi:cytochrome c oxidase subunit III